jgi:hypothetical protein
MSHKKVMTVNLRKRVQRLYVVKHDANRYTVHLGGDFMDITDKLTPTELAKLIRKFETGSTLAR